MYWRIIHSLYNIFIIVYGHQGWPCTTKYMVVFWQGWSNMYSLGWYLQTRWHLDIVTPGCEMHFKIAKMYLKEQWLMVRNWGYNACAIVSTTPRWHCTDRAWWKSWFIVSWECTPANFECVKPFVCLKDIRSEKRLLFDWFQFIFIF